jgi:hypothetical protein
MAEDDADAVELPPTTISASAEVRAFITPSPGPTLQGSVHVTAQPATGTGVAGVPTVSTEQVEKQFSDEATATDDLSKAPVADIGPLGGSFIRNPETVDQILGHLDVKTVEDLFQLMLRAAAAAAPADTAQESWQRIQDQWNTEGVMEVVQPALNRIGDEIEALRELVEDSLRGPEAPTPAQGIDEQRVRGFGALATLMVATIMSGYAYGTNDPRTMFLVTAIMGLWNLYQQWLRGRP